MACLVRILCSRILYHSLSNSAFLLTAVINFFSSSWIDTQLNSPKTLLLKDPFGTFTARIRRISVSSSRGDSPSFSKTMNRVWMTNRFVSYALQKSRSSFRIIRSSSRSTSWSPRLFRESKSYDGGRSGIGMTCATT